MPEIGGVEITSNIVRPPGREYNAVPAAQEQVELMKRARDAERDVLASAAISPMVGPVAPRDRVL
jgi:hypothetical protein